MIINLNHLQINDTGSTLNDGIFTAMTYYSGAIPLEYIIYSIAGGTSGGTGTPTYVQPGTNTYTGGTSSLPTVNVSGGSFNSIFASGYSKFDSLSANSFSAQTIKMEDFGGATPSYVEGLLFYGDDGFSAYLDNPDITLNIGQEQYIKGKNKQGTTILNGQAVYIGGASGQLPEFYLANASAHTTAHLIGLATHDINFPGNGYVTTFGFVHGIPTSGFSEGDVIYLSLTSGTLTNIAPPAPYHVTEVGVCVVSHPSNGSILVYPTQAVDLNDISKVYADENNLIDGQTLVYSGAGGYFVNRKLDYADLGGTPPSSGGGYPVQNGVNIYTGGTFSAQTINLVDSPSIYQLTLSGSVTNFTDELFQWSGNTDAFGYGKSIWIYDPAYSNFTLGSDASAGYPSITQGYYNQNFGIANILSGFSIYSAIFGGLNYAEASTGSFLFGIQNQTYSTNGSLIFGSLNTASTTSYSFMGGAYNYLAGSDYSSILVGFANEISSFAQNSSIIAGTGNKIQGFSNSSIIAGTNVVVNNNNTAFGQNIFGIDNLSGTSIWGVNRNNTEKVLSVGFTNNQSISSDIYSGTPLTVMSTFGTHDYNKSSLIGAHLQGLILDTQGAVVPSLLELRSIGTTRAAFGFESFNNLIITSNSLSLTPSRTLYLQGWSTVSYHPSAEFGMGGGWIGATVDTAWVKHTHIDNANGVLRFDVAAAGSRSTAIYMDNTRNIGIGGITSPTARLHLTAGTTSANSAPLKLNTGSYMTNPEAGALEWDNSSQQNLAFTDGTGTRRWLAFTDEIVGGSGSTAVKNGINTFTAGTPTAVSVNITGASLDNIFVSGSSTFNTLSGGTVSGGTFFSGSTPLSTIISSLASGTPTLVQPGTNTYTGGTSSLPTVNISAATLNNLTVSGATSLGVVSATTIFSGSTDLSNLFLSRFQICIPIHSDASASVTMTNQAVAEQFFANNNRVIRQADLSYFTQCRLVAQVTTNSASVNNPRLLLKGRNGAYSTTVGDYITLGVSGAEVGCSLSAITMVDSGWKNMNTTARTDIFFTVTQVGGDAAADPVVGNVMAYFR